jgi:hypothetical protein
VVGAGGGAGGLDGARHDQPLSSMSPGASAVSFMLWEMVKIGVSVAMLMLAPRLVQP